MRLSVIVPVYNNPHDLAECLAALRACPCSGCEIIVVDDASTDETPAVPQRFGARMLRLEKNSGPAAARNHGACHAQGDILFFVDADVVVAPGTVQRVVQTFAEHPEIAALFGSYDTQPRAAGVVSQYRNLLHHFVHQQGNTEAATFWAGCGAVRRTVFQELGGFDAQRFPVPSIEDIELGYRLRQAGYHIRLDKTLQGTHLKRWTLCSIIKTDVICRAIPWARLILESHMAPDDINLKKAQKVSGALIGLACISLFLAVFQVHLLALAAGACGAVVLLNWDLYSFFRRQRGLSFAIACLPLHWLYYLYSSLSYLYVWGSFQCQKARQ
jgi:glycosyltransferase involved in cell wall biosynthesis